MVNAKIEVNINVLIFALNFVSITFTWKDVTMNFLIFESFYININLHILNIEESYNFPHGLIIEN